MDLLSAFESSDETLLKKCIANQTLNFLDSHVRIHQRFVHSVRENALISSDFASCPCAQAAGSRGSAELACVDAL